MHLIPSSRQLASLLCIGALCAFGSVVRADSFTNATPIILDDDSIANPYPSNITVSGLTSPIASITVTLNGFTHSFVDDVGILLVGPTGAGEVLFDGGAFDEVTGDITFADGGDSWADATGTGTYQPEVFYDDDTFPDSAPLIDGVNPTVAGVKSLSVFNGTDANGVWSLYAVDFISGDSGAINGGWTLNIAPVPAPPSLLLFGSGLIGLLGSCRRRSKKA
jgi:subtilisin-like proprotein convertase family protein